MKSRIKNPKLRAFVESFIKPTPPPTVVDYLRKNNLKISYKLNQALKHHKSIMKIVES